MFLYKRKRRISLKKGQVVGIFGPRVGAAPHFFGEKQEICQQNQIQDEKNRPENPMSVFFSFLKFSISTKTGVLFRGPSLRILSEFLSRKGDAAIKATSPTPFISLFQACFTALFVCTAALKPP